jgi:hypothetical protein
MGERAERFRVRYPIKYRAAGEPTWHEGETVNISRTGLLFTMTAPLEVGSYVELIILLDETRGRGRTCLEVVCSGPVVRTSLASWPEIRPTAAIQFGQLQLGLSPE